VIDERGLVESVTMRVSVNPMYDRMAVDAARSWRYRPATRAGVPVKFRKAVQISVKRQQ
jgi:TonB family protein